VLLVDERIWLRRVFLGVTAFGAAYGLSLFAPLLINPDWLTVDCARGAILYDTRLIHDDVVRKTVLRTTYAAVIRLPLLASTAPGVRFFGALVTLSVLVAFLFAPYAFTSSRSPSAHFSANSTSAILSSASVVFIRRWCRFRNLQGAETDGRRQSRHWDLHHSNGHCRAKLRALRLTAGQGLEGKPASVGAPGAVARQAAWRRGC
jgi:hypothetical protein